jgi:hypothetical protein
MPVTSIGTTARTSKASSASPANDPRARDVAQRVDRLVTQRFGGDYPAAHRHYAGGASEVSAGGVRSLLSDAGVGNGLTRGAYVSALMDRFDSNRSGGVSWQEFQGGLKTIR